jgi:hypothetical protein
MYMQTCALYNLVGTSWHHSLVLLPANEKLYTLIAIRISTIQCAIAYTLSQCQCPKG